MTPQRLPAVDRPAQLAASGLARHLSSAPVVAAAASSWARALEVPVEIAALAGGDERADPTCRASAGLIMADGRAAVLTVPTQVLAGMMGALAGATPRAIGPTPLSPAEEGLFAFLALQWTALWPDPPALDWIDGGVGLVDRPAAARACLRWRVRVARQVAVARWWLPADLPGPTPAALRADLPVRGSLSAGMAAARGPLAAGDLVVLRRPAALRLGATEWPARHSAGAWRVIDPKEARVPEPLDDLPLTLDAVVGQVTLSVGEVSALVPGAVIPLAPDLIPIVTLMAGGRPIARGVLVDDDGRSAVQVTQILQSSSRT